MLVPNLLRSHDSPGAPTGIMGLNQIQSPHSSPLIVATDKYDIMVSVMIGPLTRERLGSWEPQEWLLRGVNNGGDS